MFDSTLGQALYQHLLSSYCVPGISFSCIRFLNIHTTVSWD